MAPNLFDLSQTVAYQPPSESYSLPATTSQPLSAFNLTTFVPVKPGPQPGDGPVIISTSSTNYYYHPIHPASFFNFFFWNLSP